MSNEDQARDGTDAVVKFRRLLGRRMPERIQARIHSEAGMAGLCDVEAGLSDCWPVNIAKEFIWLARSSLPQGEWLHLRAFAADGEVLCDAAFHLGPWGAGA
jgi:hypothetical protein